jgi:hypothetical protein
MSILVNFLKKNPEVLATYVVVSTKLVDRLVSPLNRFMEHLLVVQGIDPNTQPGASFRKALAAAIDGVDDSKEFQDDYDFGWVARHYEKTIKGLSHLNLSRDKFLKITDLSKLSDPPKTELEKALDKAALKVAKAAMPPAEPLKTIPLWKKGTPIETEDDWFAANTEVNRVAPESTKTETPVYTAEDIARFNKMAEKYPTAPKEFVAAEMVSEDLEKEKAVKNPFEMSGDLKASSIKEALEVLAKYAHLLEKPASEEKPQGEVNFTSTRHDRARAGVAVGTSKKTDSGYSRVVKTFGKGLFRRVNEQFEPKK